MIPLLRSETKMFPDYKKVIPRFFYTGDERATNTINRILQMPELTAVGLLDEILKDFSNRYLDIQAIFNLHFNKVQQLVPEAAAISKEKKALIGSCFTMEYAIEAASILNPSAVEAPDQSGVQMGDKKIILSFRAIGENHLSSLVFRTALLDENCAVSFPESSNMLQLGQVKTGSCSKLFLAAALSFLQFPSTVYEKLLYSLPDNMDDADLKSHLNALLDEKNDSDHYTYKYRLLELIALCYEMKFDNDSALSERVVFPVTPDEKNGIEDARLVKFREDDGSFTYYGTYTAFDGSFITPRLFTTKDFCNFTSAPLLGNCARNKNLALFPRKIHGRYAMLSRIDGVNNYIMFSTNLYEWNTAELLQTPAYPWEMIQIGNAGSPIETEKGWLIITHGVGPMRKYCLGVSIFDLDDPTKELGRLTYPLLAPNEEERNGYVPNVVYCCGAFIHNNTLFIPYALSDYASSFATISLDWLLEALLNPSSI